MADYWLISPPENKDVKFQLVQPGPFSIGRETSCGIVLADRSVSRQHASLQWTPPINQELGSWRVTDLGSAGGTFVNGVKLQAGRSLAFATVIKLKLHHGTLISLINNHPSTCHARL